MDREKNLRYVEQALSGVPEDFAGRLLEVPVGTGVLTMPIYKELPRAEITCLDYSADMMNAARRKAEAAGIRPIRIITGHTGWTDEPDFAFLHMTELCKPFTKKYVDPAAPYDGYVEDDDTEERARTVRLGKVGKK